MNQNKIVIYQCIGKPEGSKATYVLTYNNNKFTHVLRT